MLKRITYFLLLVFVASILSTCKKYPDGPAFSLRTKRARVIGTWSVESFSVNGEDSTSQLTCNAYTFKDKGHREMSWCGHSTTGDAWMLLNHKENISIHLILDSTEKTPFPISYNDTFSPYDFGSSLSWEIQRLTNKQMWLKINFNSKEYYIKFNKN